MAVLHSFKLQGQTSADAAIATVEVTLDTDGMLRFTDARSVVRAIPLNGDLAALIKDLFTGTGGYEATIVAEPFDVPVLSGAGVNGRADS
jgi:hypothetical protein